MRAVSRVEPSELPSVDVDHTTVATGGSSFKLEGDRNIDASWDIQIEGSVISFDSSTGKTSVRRANRLRGGFVPASQWSTRKVVTYNTTKHKVHVHMVIVIALIIP